MGRPGLLLWMALRYSLKRSINVFALAAILLSVACLFTVNAVLKGFEEELESLIRGSRADISVEWRGAAPSLADIEKRMPPATVWAPALKGFGLLRTDSFIAVVSVKGVHPRREAALRSAMKLKPLDLSPLEGPARKVPLSGLLGVFEETGGEEAPVLLGEALAQDLLVHPGDRITLKLPNWNEGVASGSFSAAGTFRTGLYEDDRGKVFLHLDSTQALLEHPAGFSEIEVAAGAEAAGMKARLKSAFPEAEVRAWYEREPVSLKAMRHQRLLMAIVLSLIVVVSSFSILAIQWNFVREKTPDIGLLRATGFSSADIFAIFLGVSWMVGCAGLVGGLGTGMLLSTYANEIIHTLGLDLFPGDLYYIDGLPVRIELRDCAWISGLSLSITTLAGLLPAWMAVRIEPVEALRRE